MQKIIFLGFALLFSTVAFSQSISSSVMSASGTSFESEDFTLHFSIGEPLNTLIEDGEIMLSQGVIQITLNEVFSEVDEVTLTNAISVYPNPTAEKVTVQIDHQNELFSYKVFDINGVLLQQAELTAQTTTLNVEDLSKGAYILKILKNEKEYQSLKILKQ